MIPLFFNPSPVSAATTPGQILSNIELWLRGTPTSMSTSVVADTQTIPTNGQTLGGWLYPGDAFGGENPGHLYAEQATSGDRPSVTVATGVYTVNAASGDDLDIKDEGSDASVSLTGDFVMWVVLKTDRSSYFLWAGGNATTGFFRVASNGRITFSPDSGSPQVTTAADKLVATSTRTLVRVRRVSNTVYVATSGYAEVNLGTSSGTVTIDRLLSAGGLTSTVVADIGEILISTSASAAASPPASIDGANGWFKTGRYGSEPAWNLQI